MIAPVALDAAIQREAGAVREQLGEEGAALVHRRLLSGRVRRKSRRKPMLVRLPVLLDSVFDLVYRPADKRLAIPGYRRQYIGITKWTGERTVYVSAFHELEQSLRSGADTLQWRQTPVSRCDGGLMYFGVEYDPAKRRFGRLHFNHRSTGAIRY
jgi:hypothetical protein